MVPVWTRWETSFTGNRYTNPYTEVDLQVTYSGPGGSPNTGSTAFNRPEGWDDALLLLTAAE